MASAGTMMAKAAGATGAGDARLGRALVLDEIFDLSLYRTLRRFAGGSLRETLDELIAVETRHVAFWQKFFGLERVTTLDAGRRVKLAGIALVCRVFGNAAIHLVLEAIEVHGVRKYLAIWRRYADGPLGAAVREVLEDEFKHEDAVVSGDAERRINPDTVRNVFLGLNDGLVEIVGAVSGFFAAFGGQPLAVLAAGTTVAVAGSFSMAAGAYIATSSESEVRETEEARRRFLGEATEHGAGASPLGSAALVGLSYFAGALVPVLPVVFGARSALVPVLGAAAVIVIVSAIVAFLSGMQVRRRIAMNIVITALAVAVTYVIGLATKALLGIDL